MNERVPDSTGLPLRAMVMVLLFLGVVFLLLGWQAIGSSGNSDDDSASTVASSVSSSTSTAPATSVGAKPEANQAEVRVYNISSTSGVAARTKDQLIAAGFKVTTADNLSVPEVSATTVYYTDSDGEKATADAVGEKLGAQVEPRIDAIKNQPAGVIVLAVG